MAESISPERPEPRGTVVLLAVEPGAPALARAAVHDWLGPCPGLPRVMLAASELVSNVVRHAPATRRLELHLLRERDTLRLEVLQEGHGFTALPGGPPPVDRLNGRGLPVVAAVADRWGVAEGDGLTLVWALFERCPGDLWA